MTSLAGGLINVAFGSRVILATGYQASDFYQRARRLTDARHRLDRLDFPGIDQIGDHSVEDAMQALGVAAALAQQLAIDPQRDRFAGY
jgi:hypothetical protein